MKSKKIIFLLAGLLLVGCDNADKNEPINNENNVTNNTAENNTVQTCEHNFAKYDEVLPSYSYDGYVAHYKCSKCDALKDVNNQPTTADAIKLEKAGDNIGLSINGTQKGTFTLLEKKENEASWKIENVELKVNDVLSINKPGDVSYKYAFFNGNKITNDKKSELEGTFTINLFATPNGFVLSIVEPVQKALVVKVNQERYPLTQVTYYQSETQTYIYGYHYFAVGDVMVVDDEVNGQIYNYLDLDEDMKWNVYDFHKGNNSEIVFDVAGKYGIEFSRGGDKKISITKSFAPVSEGNFALDIFTNSTIVPLEKETIAAGTEDYESLAWYEKHEAVINNDDNKAAIENGISLYMASCNVASNLMFRVANIIDSENAEYIGTDHLISVKTEEGAVTIDDGYFKINKPGIYLIMYIPAFDSIFITQMRAPVLSTIYAVVDGKQMNLTSDANTCVHINNQHMDANKTISYFKINNGNPEYINLTLDSSIDSSIATTMTTQGMTFIVFKKAGTYNITLNLSTNVVTMTYELDPVPEGIDPTHNLTVTLNITRGSDRITQAMTVNQTTGKAIASHLDLKQGDIILNVSVLDMTIYESYSISKFADGYDTSILNVQTFDTFNMNTILKESTYQITLDLATQLLSIQETLE